MTYRKVIAQQHDSEPSAIGWLAGTPAFMAPEIIEGSRQVDGRSDLYAVGCVAYWLLTGRFVFEGDNVMQIIGGHLAKPAPRLTENAAVALPDALEALVASCLEKNPARRPASARQLADGLAEVVSSTGAWTQKQACEWWESHRLHQAQLTDPLATTQPPLELAKGRSRRT